MIYHIPGRSNVSRHDRLKLAMSSYKENVQKHGLFIFIPATEMKMEIMEFMIKLQSLCKEKSNLTEKTKAKYQIFIVDCEEWLHELEVHSFVKA